MITLASMKQGNEFLYAQSVVDYLQGCFPGYQWTACVDKEVLYMKNLTLSGKWGMQKPVDQVDKAWILKAGGEMLDRFNMPTILTEAALDRERDFTGDFKSEKWRTRS